MEYYEVERHIAAPPEKVWKMLTDGQALVSGSLGMTQLDGVIAEGNEISIFSEVSPKRAFKVRIMLDAPRKMVWSGGMPLGLFKGVRTFSLTPQNDGTGFHMREEFSGVMLPMIWKSMPDLQPSFEKFADGLVKMVEGS